MSLWGSSYLNCFLLTKSASVLNYLFIHSWLYLWYVVGKHKIGSITIKAIATDNWIYFLCQVRFTAVTDKHDFQCGKNISHLQKTLLNSTVWFSQFTCAPVRKVMMKSFDILAMLFVALLATWRGSWHGFFHWQCCTLEKEGTTFLCMYQTNKIVSSCICRKK